MSEIKVNKLSPRTNCGTVQLGDSGDTITIPAGATITNNGTAAGFGATGAASWDTTVKTSGFTAVSGVGYFVNTTSGAISVNLPAGTAGDVVAIKDYAKTFDTNNVTLVQNGSDKIGGSTVNATLSTEGLAVTLVYVDATKGWLVTDSGLQDDAPTAQYITATGGTETTSGDYKIHTFTGPGTFTVCSVGNACGSNSVDYLVVAGGGGGASSNGGGGGAGGYRESCGTGYTSSPLGACVSALPVTAQGYPITVGGGGSAGTTPPAGTGGAGSPSSGLTITSTGGGASGAGVSTPNFNAGTGGSGGGGGSPACVGAGSGGSGNTPPVSPPQGNNGGNGFHDAAFAALGGGGGGATTAGSTVVPNNPLDTPVSFAGPGGNGATSSIDGTPTARGGGGGGGTHPNKPTTYGIGGLGGGGPGGAGGSAVGVAGTVNTGGGGGGGSGDSSNGGGGGSGIVIIRYKFQ